MKSLYFILFYFMMLSDSFGVTLQELKEKAKKRAPSLKYHEMKIEESLQKKKMNKASFFPHIGFDASMEKESGDGFDSDETTGSVYGRMNLFNQFKDKAKYTNSEKLVSISKSEKKIQETNIKLEIEKIYYEKLLYSSLVKNLEMALKRNQTHLNLINKRLSAGLISKSDVIEFRLRRSQMESKMFLYKAEEKRMKKVLAFLTGLSINELDKLDRDELPHYIFDTKQEEEITSKIESLSPQLKLEKKKAESFAIYDTYSGYNWLPTVDLESRFGRFPEDETLRSNKLETLRVGVYLNWEIFNGGEKFAKNKMAKIQKEKSLYKLKSEYVKLQKSLMKSFEELEHVQERIQIDENSLKIANNLYQRTVSEYKRGVKDSGALASVSDTIFETVESIYEFKMEFIKYKMLVEAGTGQPLKVKEVSHVR